MVMRAKIKLAAAAMVVVAVRVGIGAVWAQDAPGEEAAKTVVLNTYGIWRFHCTIATC